MFSSDVGPVHLRVEDRAALAAGAGDDVDVDALGDVLRRRGRALARLVVGVGVDGHQPQAARVTGTIIAHSADTPCRQVTHDDPDTPDPAAATATTGRAGDPAWSPRLVLLATAFVGWVIWAALGAAAAGRHRRGDRLPRSHGAHAIEVAAGARRRHAGPVVLHGAGAGPDP